MLSLTSLRNAINQQLSDAQSKRQLADSLMKTAEQHAATGDYARAQLDRESAERYLRDLRGIENTIAGYEAEIMSREQKAKEIDKKIEDLNRHFEHDIEQLEKSKSSVKTAILTVHETEAVRRQLKNKGIDNREEERRKRYQHDLERLQREKHDLVG